MFLYGTKFGEAPTFAPNYDDVVARETSQADAAAALWDTTRNLQLWRDNANAEDTALAEAYERRNKAIFEATGVQLPNPRRNFSDKDLQAAARTMDAGGDPFSVMADLEAGWRRKAAELAREKPAFAGVIAADRPMREDAAALVSDARQAAAQAEQQATAAGLGTARRLANSLGGGIAGALRDPLQVGTLWLGGGISTPARTVGMRLLESFLTEAAVNGGVETGVQIAAHDWKVETGEDASVSTALQQVGLTALFGGGFGGLLQGGREVFRLLGRDAPAAELERISRGEAQPGDMAAVAEALGIDADPAALRAADLAAEQPALDRAAFGEVPAGLDPAEAERLAAEAVRMAESPDDMRISRVVQDQFPIGAPPKRPVTLMQFLTGRSVGGIRDESGELAAMGLTRKFVPGGGALVRERGKSLDMAREAAAEAGYFDHIYGDPDRAIALSTPDDLLRLLREEAGGKPAYSARNDGGREFEWMEYEQAQKAQEAYRRLLEEVDGAAATLELGHIRDSVLVRAAELVDDETDHMAALEKALDEDYRLQGEADIDLGEPADAELEIPFFEDGQDPGAVHSAGRAPGEARADGELSGERGALAQDGERLSGPGGYEGAPQQRLKQPGETPEPASAEAGELAELALTEARRADNTQPAMRLEFSDAAAPLVIDTPDGLADLVTEPMKTLLKQVRAFMLDRLSGKTVRNAADGSEIVIAKSGIKHFFSGKHNRATLAAGARLDAVIENATPSGALPDEKGRQGVRMWHYYDRNVQIGERRARIRVVVREMEDARRYYDHFELWDGGSKPGGSPEGSPARDIQEPPSRNIGDGPATEKTPAGEQTLLEGVKPVSTREKLEAEGAKPMRGGDAAPPEGGLFDLDARGQLDIWDAMPAAKGADGDTLHATHDTMIAEADRTEFFGDLIAACKD